MYKRQVEWLGFNWKSQCFTSDYFDDLYECAKALIKSGDAYVDSLSADEISEYRGTLKNLVRRARTEIAVSSRALPCLRK